MYRKNAWEKYDEDGIKKIFDFNDDGLAETIIDTVPAELEETAKDAIIQCPTEAIVEVNEDETSELEETE